MSGPTPSPAFTTLAAASAGSPSTVDWLTLAAALLAVAATVFGVIRAELASRAGWQRDLRLAAYEKYFLAADDLATLVLSDLVNIAGTGGLQGEDRHRLEVAQRKYNAAFHSALIVASAQVVDPLLDVNRVASEDLLTPGFRLRRRFSGQEVAAWTMAAAQLQRDLFNLVLSIRAELGFPRLPGLKAEARIINRASASFEPD